MKASCFPSFTYELSTFTWKSQPSTCGKNPTTVALSHVMGKLLLQMALQSLDFSRTDFSTLRGLEQPGFAAAVPLVSAPGALQRSLGPW